jgi:hypothetical protein
LPQLAIDNRETRRAGGRNRGGQLKVSLGISVADILDEPAQEGVVVRQFAARNLLSEDVAEDAPEVLMARVRHEGAGVGDHADETREQAGIRQRIDLRGDALLLIEEPPGAAVLDFARFLALLKATGQSRELKCVGGVHVVQNDLGESVLLREQVEVSAEMLRLRKIADRIETGIGSKLAAGSGVHVAEGTEVKLFGPAFFGVEAAEEKHHEGCKLDLVLGANGPAFTSL